MAAPVRNAEGHHVQAGAGRVGVVHPGGQASRSDVRAPLDHLGEGALARIAGILDGEPGSARGAVEVDRPRDRVLEIGVHLDLVANLRGVAGDHSGHDVAVGLAARQDAVAGGSKAVRSGVTHLLVGDDLPVSPGVDQSYGWRQFPDSPGCRPGSRRPERRRCPGSPRWSEEPPSSSSGRRCCPARCPCRVLPHPPPSTPASQ